MKNVTLNNDVEMPILGFGVFQIPVEETEKAVLEAFEVGYRHIDTAASYMNEEAVGRAIKASGIPREQLFITTKLWLNSAGVGKTEKAFKRSLERLQLDYLDLYLIHQPFGDYYGAWHDMEKLNKSGDVRAIGVANFYPDRLVDLTLQNDIKPAVNQIETHPFFQRADDQERMKALGIQIESWGPFAEGKNEIFTNPVLAEIGKAHNKSVAQVILHWLIQRDIVVIPKSVRQERMKENFEVFDFELTADEMAVIVGLDGGESLFFDHRTPEAAEWLASYKPEV